MSEELPETDQNRSRLIFYLAISLGAVLFLFASWLWLSTAPPAAFPLNTPVAVETGLSASEVIETLKEQNLIRSETIFYLTLLLFHDPGTIKAGEYKFTKPLSVFALASRLTGSAPPEELVVVTFPEGFTAKEYAVIADNVLPEFDAEQFLNLASSSEGFLFPDTYHVPADYHEAELFTLLTETYYEHTAPFRQQLEDHKLTEQGLITLASLLEREANTPESMGIVAGILDTRLSIGMPLQADASMEYVLEKPLSELTPSDLEIDSPYNTYLYKGLPPTPIGNPGLAAIEAVLSPTYTDYLFYITGNDGEFYYAETFAEHKLNIARYLRP